MTTPFLEIHDVSMTFRTAKRVVHALVDVDLAVGRGETLVLVGESGSGKSTLGEIVLGTLQPTGGEVVLDGRTLKPTRTKAERRRIQLVQQNPMTSLNPRQTIASSVGLPIRVHRLQPKGLVATRVEALLASVGISSEHLRRFPAVLSGGQRQRVALARALAAEPDLIVLDEPTSALDVSVQARVLELLDREQRQRGLTYIFITHDLGVARSVGTQIAVLYRGRIVEVGPAVAVFARPRHWYTVLLLSSVPVVSAAEARARPTWPSAAPAGAIDQSEGGCAFRDRCPRAIAVCNSITPPLVATDMHAVACHNPNQDVIAWPAA